MKWSQQSISFDVAAGLSCFVFLLAPKRSEEEETFFFCGIESEKTTVEQ